MLTRREWLSVASAAMASPAGSRIVLQTYIWQQRFRDLSLAELCATARRAGYTQLELMPAFLEADGPRTIREHGLQPAIVYSGGILHDEAAAAKTVAQVVGIARRAKELGVSALNFNQNPKPGKALKSDEELAVQAKFLRRLSADVTALGLRFFSHNHDAEMRDNAREWRHIFAHTEVEFCLDIDWIAQGGQDPLKLLAEAGRRVGSLHIRNAKKRVWLEAVGEGDVDYTMIAKKLTGSPYLVVELAYAPETAVTRDLEENLRLSRTFVEWTFGK